VVEYDMAHVILTREGLAGMDGRMVPAVLADVKRHLCPEYSEAEHKLINMVHPMFCEEDREHGQVEFAQQMETAP
jgi:hypothetical protein